MSSPQQSTAVTTGGRMEITIGGKTFTPDSDLVVVDAKTGAIKGVPFYGVFANPKKSCYQVDIKLREDLGECAMIQGKLVPTIPGYRKGNQYAGLNCLKPEMVNREKPTNPFVIYDDLGYVREIWGRVIAIGHSPTGQLVMSDVTHYINMGIVVGQDVLSVITKNPSAGTVAPKDNCPDKWEAEVSYWENNTRKSKKVEGTKKSHMVYIPIISNPVEIGIHFDPLNAAVLDAFSNAYNRQKFIQTMVMNVAERNALSAHPAIATKALSIISSESKKAVGLLTVYASKDAVTESQLKEVTEKIKKGQKLAEEGQIVTMETEHSAADIVDDLSDFQDVTDNESTPATQQPVEAEPAPEKLPKAPKTKEDFMGLIKEKIDPIQFLDKYGKTMGEATLAELQAIWGEIK